jgi:hypothetical protein
VFKTADPSLRYAVGGFFGAWLNLIYLQANGNMGVLIWAGIFLDYYFKNFVR